MCQRLVCAQNPHAQTPAALRAGLPPGRGAHYPEVKAAEFGGHPWIPAKDPELLDFPGTQLLLIGSRPAPQGVLLTTPSSSHCYVLLPSTCASMLLQQQS